MQTTVEFETKAEYETAYPLLSRYPVTWRCTSAPEFIETLLEIANEDTHIFRGQNCSHWPIIATLFRKDFIAKTAIDFTYAMEAGESGPGEYFDTFLSWEHEIVEGFADSCMYQGISLPYIPFNETLQFDTEAVSAYFVARTYGIPNRLLDFTTSAIVAAWFAADVEHAADSNKETNEIVVWAIKQDSLSRTGYEWVSTFWANAQIPQMQRQKAVLLVDRNGKDNYLATGKFQPMEFKIEDFLRSFNSRSPFDLPIRRLTLPQDQALELRGTLGNYDLSHIHLFPTIENVAKRTLGQFARIPTVKSIHETVGRD